MWTIYNAKIGYSRTGGCCYSFKKEDGSHPDKLIPLFRMIFHPVYPGLKSGNYDLPLSHVRGRKTETDKPPSKNPGRYPPFCSASPPLPGPGPDASLTGRRYRPYNTFAKLSETENIRTACIFLKFFRFPRINRGMDAGKLSGSLG